VLWVRAMRLRSLTAVVFSIGLWGPLSGCNESPPDLREWRPKDHDHTQNPNAAQVEVGDAAAEAPAAKLGLDDVTLVAWRNSCTTCHGTLGRGDGPQGPMVKAADLSSPTWQASVTDDAIASVIRDGKGRMPSFDLPSSTVQGLVRLIRVLNLARQATTPQARTDAGTAANAHAPQKATPPPGSKLKRPPP
jgi:mono/diheme cytochrome c family protein